MAIVVGLGGGGSPAEAIGGSADVAIVSSVLGTPNGSNQCVNPAPTEIPIATDVSICNRLVFQNNGPMDPVDVSITRSATFAHTGGQQPNECTISPVGGLVTFNNVDISDGEIVRDETYTVNCNRPSFHTFRIVNTLSPGPAGVTDPDLTNNTATTDLTVGVTAEADFSIVAQTLRAADCSSDPPTTIPVNTDVDFCLVKTIHNGGPYGPTAADIFFRSNAAPGCSIDPFTTFQGAQLHVSVNTVIQESFTVRCTEPSFHSFTIENFLEPTDPHVSDPNVTDPPPNDPDGNEYEATTHTVSVVAQTDYKIQSQVATSSGNPQPNQPFTVTVDKTLHNNGPYSPVLVDITPTVTAPGCDVVPDPGNPTSANLFASQSVQVTEVFTLTCPNLIGITISVDNCLSIDILHVEDPEPDNCRVTLVLEPTPTPTTTSTATATATQTATATATQTATATATPTATATATQTAAATATRTATATATRTATATATQTATATATQTATATATPTGTPTATTPVTATATPTGTALSATRTPQPSTPAPTDTAVPATTTPSPTALEQSATPASFPTTGDTPPSSANTGWLFLLAAAAALSLVGGLARAAARVRYDD